VLAHPGVVRVVSKRTVQAAALGDVKTYTHAVEDVLAADDQIARLGVG